jgi:hypothetical protein
MRAAFFIASTAMLIAANSVVADKKPQPAVGKICYADPKTGKWIELTPGPDDNFFLECMNPEGKAQPCSVDSVQPVGLQDSEFSKDFIVTLKPRQK